MHIVFQKGVDNFEIEPRDRAQNMLIFGRGAVPP